MREKLFEKLDNSPIAHPEDNTLFRNFVVFNFEAICVQSVETNNTATTSWIGTHVLVSVSKNKAYLRRKFLALEAEIKTKLIDFSPRLHIFSETQPNISSETEDSNVSKFFYESSKNSYLISSVISTIMLTLHQILDSKLENMT